MAKTQTTGMCRSCREKFSGQAMRRHLASCPKRTQGSTPTFDLRARAGPYWLYLEMSAKATLEDLDSLLRRTWLECCGHLSAFRIDGTSYQRDTGELDEAGADLYYGAKPDQPMSTPVGRLLQPGMKFSYEYDFGSTTELELETLTERQGPGPSPEITILARNDPPEIPCPECPKLEGGPAKTICTECDTPLCAGCARKHGCSEEMRRPLVNSPRAVVCGYTGSREDR